MIADFERLLGTDLADIAALASSFADWGAQAGLTQREIFQLNVMLEELVTNVIVHGLGVGGPGWVRLRIARQGDYLALELRDNAPPFDPFQAPPPQLDADIDARMVGGLGVHLVRTLVDECGYARTDGLNIVRLRKRLDAPLSGCGSS
jgi:serine/threonine-protein kinase RsbW